MDTINEPHWTTILSFLFFLSFLICQVIATGFVILAQKKNIAHYCWPRLVLITGLVVCSTVACIVMLCYFGGAASAMNNFFFNAFEYFFYQTFDENQRAEIKSELKLYAAALFVLAITFGLYSVFELMLTRKFYMSLSQFSAVPQIEPSAPHPAYNPDYTQPPTKIYPNIA
uniref:Uncharacterized protein n=1 Tax=Heterorhabditis bacteriophora TaxID=37862 RepID=A0A1I7X7M4_HETBA